MKLVGINQENVENKIYFNFKRIIIQRCFGDLIIKN